MNQSKVPSDNISPPTLYRTLSEQHWIAGRMEMVRMKAIKQWVGNQGDWYYYLKRDNSDTPFARQITTFCGVIENVSNVILPTPQQCAEICEDGQRCDTICFDNYCSRHFKNE